MRSSTTNPVLQFVAILLVICSACEINPTNQKLESGYWQQNIWIEESSEWKDGKVWQFRNGDLVASGVVFGSYESVGGSEIRLTIIEQSGRKHELYCTVSFNADPELHLPWDDVMLFHLAGKRKPGWIFSRVQD